MSDALTFDNRAIIPHPREPRLMLVRDGSGWTLPRAGYDGRDYSDALAITHALRERHGLAAILLRCAYHHRDGATVRRALAFENRSPEWTVPDGAAWFGRADLPDVGEFGAALDRWFAPPPPQRSPWARPGWFDRAAGWMLEQVARAGLESIGPVEQVRTWSISATLRARTDGGDLYMKASPALWAYEPVLTRYLAERFPEQIPSVVTVEPDRSWLLMRDFGRTLLGDSPELDRWEAAVRLIARIQIELIAHASEWLALGCLDRRLDVLAGQIGALAADAAATLPGDPRGLSEDEITRLRAAVPRLEALCLDLSRRAVPYTLEHGDFHPWNVVLDGDRIVFFDWSDGCLAHPFFSMAAVIEHQADFPKVPDAASRLLDAYLEPWTVFEPMERLRETFAIAQTLAAVHLAWSYHRIIAHLEEDARWEMGGAVPHYLRMALESLR